MKTNKPVLRFGLILLIFLTSGCGRLVNLTTSTTMVAKTPITPFNTSTALPIISTATPTVRTTSAPTLVKTSTPISIPSAPPSIIPTLSVKDAQDKLLDMLTNNGRCQFPCLLGITPGTTTIREVKTILSPMSGISDLSVFNTESGVININSELKGDQLLNINLSYLANQDKVYGVYFRARDMKKIVNEHGGDYFYQDIFDSIDFSESLDIYMLHQVLTNQGRPSSVLLNTWGEFPPPRYGQGHFNLILIYPEQGIVVQYTTEMQVVGKNVVGCLANAHVEMALFPAGNIDDFNKQLALTDWKGRIENYKPIEEVTSMSIDDFYQTFQQHPEKCLVTPANMWPLPEK